MTKLLKYYFFLGSLVMHFALQAQNIVSGEYFYDTDPGIGNASPFTFTGPSDNIIETIEFETTGLLPGTHKLSIRTLDDSNEWGHVRAYLFVISSTSPSDGSTNFSEGEYFYDEDPGIGNGTPFLFSGSSNNIDEVIELDTDGLDEGTHVATIRIKDEKGNWGHGRSYTFRITPNGISDATTLLISGEYFMVTDPGIGNATPFTLDPQSNSVIHNMELDTDTLKSGIHQIFYRIKDEKGNWGFARSFQFFLKEKERPDGIPLTRIEYFATEDPGIGNGTFINLPAAIEQDTVIEIDIDTDGMQIDDRQRIGLRLYDDSNYISVNKGEIFKYCPQTPDIPTAIGGTICQTKTNSSITFQASGGAEGRYNWWNRISGLDTTVVASDTPENWTEELKPGNNKYFVSVFNPSAICKHSSRVEVTAELIPQLPPPSINDQNPLLCKFNEVTFEPEGAPERGGYYWSQIDTSGENVVFYSGETWTTDTLSRDQRVTIRPYSEGEICIGEDTLVLNLFTKFCHPSTVYFNAVNNYIFGDPALTLEGYASADIYPDVEFPLTYTILSGSAQMLNATDIDFTDVGDVIIEASFPGNDTIAKSIPVVDTIRVIASSAGLEITSNNPVCEGEVLTLNGSSIIDATYDWTGPNGFTSTERVVSIHGVGFQNAGTYTLRAEKSSAEVLKATDSIIVYPRAPQVGIQSIELEACGNKSYELVTFGGEYDAFRWYLNGSTITRSDTSNFFPYTTGVYSVQAIDSNGCRSFSPPIFIDMDADSVPTISFLTNPDRLKSSPAVSYQWYVNNLIVANGSTQELQLYVNGEYRVKVVNQEGCEIYSNSIVVNRESLTDMRFEDFVKNGVVYLPVDEQSYNTISLHPNPSNSLVEVEFRATVPTTYNYVLSSPNGNIISTGQLDYGGNDFYQTQLEVTNFNAGVYFISIQGADIYRTEKLIVSE